MRRSLFFVLSFAVIAVPTFAFADLVPCDGPSCRACDLVSMGQNILTFFIQIMAVVIALVFALGGFKMIMSAGDTGAVSSAKQMMTNAVIGFVILLSGYLIVDTILKQFVDEGSRLGPWNVIQCVDAPPPTTPTPTTPPVRPPSGGACSTSCTAIPQGITIKNGACSGSGPCTVSSEISGNLSQLDQGLDSAGLNWQITEAWPPTVTHSNPCHSLGTCVDANFTGGTPATAGNIQLFINQANMSGMRAVWEVKTQAAKDALVSSGVSASSIQVVSHITAPHFSVYKGGGGG